MRASASTAPQPARPLQAVVSALGAGAASVDAVMLATGLSRDVVDAAIDHLRRIGRLDAEELAAGCPAGGCGSCGAARPGETCPTSGTPTRRGPVLVQLRQAPSGA